MGAHHGCRGGTEQVMVCRQKEEQGRRKVVTLCLLKARSLSLFGVKR